MYKLLPLQAKEGYELKFLQLHCKVVAFCMLVLGQKDLGFVRISLATSLLSKSLDVYHSDHSNTYNSKKMTILNSFIFVQSLRLALKLDSDDKEHAFGFQVAALAIMLLTSRDLVNSLFSAKYKRD